MYSIISENIITNENGIAYIYSIPQINLMYSNAQQVSDNMTAIIKKVKMPGEILILPSAISKDTVEKKYNEIAQRFEIDDELVSSREQYIKETLELIAKTEKYLYNVYLVFNERSTTKSGIFRNNSKQIVSKRQIDLALKLNDLLFDEICKIQNKSEKTDFAQTTWILNYLAYNTEEKVDCSIYSESINNLKILNESYSGKSKTVFSRVSQAKAFPLEAKSFDFIEQIISQNFAIDISIKFDIDINNAKLEKKMYHASNNIRKAQKNYKRDNGRVLQEYKEAINIAEEGVKDFQSIDSALIHFQMCFRLRGRTEKLVENRYQMLKKNMKSNDIDIISSAGKQYMLHQHFQIMNLKTEDYVQKVSNEYFKTLHLQAGNNIGLYEWKDSIIKVYQYPNKVPVFIDEFAPLIDGSDIKATSSVVAYTGMTGSGKTGVANNNMFANVFMKGTKILQIDPKGDRRGISEKIKNGKSFINEIDLSDTERYTGALDPFVLLRDDIPQLRLSVTSLIKFFLSLNEKLDLFDNEIIINVLDDLINNNEEPTMTSYLELISNHSSQGEEIARIVGSFKTLRYASLYFSNSTTATIINYDKPINIILLSEINMSDITSIEGRLNAKTLIDVELLAKRFMRDAKGNFEIHIEEYEYYVGLTKSNIGREFSKLIRSFGGALYIYAQNPSAIEEDVLSQLSSIFIGNLKSERELDFICSEYRLNKRDFLFLLNSVDEDNKSEGEKYIFLYIDVNNRKAKVRMEILPMFKKAIDTKLKHKEVGVS